MLRLISGLAVPVVLVALQVGLHAAGRGITGVVRRVPVPVRAERTGEWRVDERGRIIGPRR